MTSRTASPARLAKLLAAALAASLLLMMPASAIDLRGLTSSVTSEIVDPVLSQQLTRATALDRLTVFVHADDVATSRAAALRSGLLPVTTWDRIGVTVAVGTPTQILAVSRAAGVTYVEADQELVPLMDTSHVATRGAEAREVLVDADGNEIDGRGTSIAVIDSGIDGTHPMFELEDGSSKVRRNLKNICAVNPFPALQDTCYVDFGLVNDTDTISVGGHGTHVAGTAAGLDVVTGDGVELSGAAPGAELIGLSVGAVILLLDTNSAMNWVLENHENPCAGATNGPTTCNPVKATNHSYGPAGNPGKYNANSATARLQDELVKEGIAVVWAAGNSGGNGTTSTTNPPGQSPTPGVFSVASYFDQDTGTRDGVVSSFSSRGEEADQSTYPDISTPGQNINSACRAYLVICRGGNGSDRNYGVISGTSMAAPHMAGIATLLFQANPALTPGDVEKIIKDTAHKFTDGAPYVADPRNSGGTHSFDKGAGLVDVVAALEAAGAKPADGGETVTTVSGPGNDNGLARGAGNRNGNGKVR